jgi:hypothetical protein
MTSLSRRVYDLSSAGASVHAITTELQHPAKSSQTDYQQPLGRNSREPQSLMKTAAMVVKTSQSHTKRYSPVQNGIGAQNRNCRVSNDL